MQLGSVAPGFDPNQPASHTVQLKSPAREYLPAGQIVSAGVEVLLPAGHVYPAEQNWHIPDPAGLNLPATHNAAVALVEPATQA